MRRIVLGMHHINVTQRQYEPTGMTHKYIPAVDLAGQDSGIDYWKAIDGDYKCIAKWGNAGGTAFAPVDQYGKYEMTELADGKVGYYAIYLVHHINSIKLGQVIKKGGVLYQEGTAGNATGNHIHMEAFSFNPNNIAMPRIKAKDGQYYCANYIEPSELWIDTDYSTIVNLKGQSFGMTSEKQETTEPMKIPYGYSTQIIGGITAQVYRAKSADGFKPFFINSGDYNELKKITEFDSDEITKSAVINANYFQMRTGQADVYGTHYGVEQDSRIKHYTQAPKDAGLLVFYMDKQEKCHVTTANNYWDAEDDNLFACTPYAVRVHDSQLTYDRSTALGDKDNIKNTQSVLAKIGDDWCVAAFKACYPRDTVTFFRSFEDEVKELCVFDSGGSTQMRAFTGGSVKLVAAGDGRKIPNVIALAQLVNPVVTPEPEPAPAPEPEKPSETDALKAQIDELKTELDKAAQENAELLAEVSTLKVENSSLSAEKDVLETKIAKALEDLK